MRSAVCGLLLGIINFSVGAQTLYDERGNPLPQKAVEQKAQQKSETPAAQNIPGEATDEEAEEAKKKRQALTKVYFENAQLHLRAGNIEKALEFLRRASEAGDDQHAKEARLQALWLRARRGDNNIAAEAETLPDELKTSAFMRVADGYATCARELVRKDCYSEAERLYALLAEQAPLSPEGILAALRLGQLLVEEQKPESALPHLVRVLQNERQSGKKSEIPFDRAWFLLGRVYEMPWYSRDVHKAEHAYRQVLNYPQSPYHQEAKNRIRYLKQFGMGMVNHSSPSPQK
ncbi:MAG: hypothetical protein N2Z22_09920 [Turneriella sp.]|nr:hypothetical protein [Leptospiraceae bacterium]MCX7633634.1 hypothetical protein [Turneriella sp.]